MNKNWSIRLEGDGRSRTLVYTEPGYTLNMYLDMAGVKEFDWVGNSAETNEWSSPSGEKINAEKIKQIVDRVHEWSHKNNVKISI